MDGFTTFFKVLNFGNFNCRQAGFISVADHDIVSAVYAIDEIVYVYVDAPVQKTGQTLCYDIDGHEIDCTGTDQDGDLQMGVEWPDPRFADNLNGTITDNLTGLLWLKNADCFGHRTWADALSDCNGLANSSCGLTDGSSPDDWRLPNSFELESLLDMSNRNPALPTVHPFTGVWSDSYWSSTTYMNNPTGAWIVLIGYGNTQFCSKGGSNYVWPVRGPE